MYRSNRRPNSRPYRSYGGPRRRFSRPPKQKGIHVSMFINKAEPDVEEQETERLVTFEEIPFLPVIQAALKRRKFTEATPIQSKAMPHILAGKDVIGLANTGTGKTGAFVLPLLQKILTKPDERVLIMVPTRELGLQIKEEIFQFSYGMRIYSALCIGGANIRFQMDQLRRNPQFIIGTPGRLKDLIQRGALTLDNVHTVVLDEADRMLDMGFIDDITALLSYLPEDRQSLFFSATLNKSLNQIVARFLKDPVTVSVVKQATAKNIDQDIVKVEYGQNKIDVLDEVLQRGELYKVLIFGKTKRGVDVLSIQLNKRGFRTSAIHGDKPQRKREQAIRLFKQNAVDILIATDVAARGIDIPDISHVINYDQPATYEDYVHRIGRTGRGNKKGSALTFV